jgi:hypothetical protein
MPILSVFFGIIVRMWHDDHPPPHIHVEYQGFERWLKSAQAKSAKDNYPKKPQPLSKNGVCDIRLNCLLIGNMVNALSLWSAFREQIKMIKLIKAHYLGDYQVELHFSDGVEGILNGHTLLQQSGPLLEPLKEESYFQRLFIDAGALC